MAYNDFVSWAIAILIATFLNGLILFFIAKFFKENISYRKAIFVSSILSVVLLVSEILNNVPYTKQTWLVIMDFLAYFTFQLILPKLIFDLEWKKGLLIGLVWFLSQICLVVVLAVLGIIFFYGWMLANWH